MSRGSGGELREDIKAPQPTNQRGECRFQTVKPLLNASSKRCEGREFLKLFDLQQPVVTERHSSFTMFGIVQFESC